MCKCSTICDPILGNRSKSHIRQNQTNTTSIQPHHSTINFQPKIYSACLRLIVAGVSSRWCERLEWRFQALVSVWAGNIQCLSSPNVHRVDYASSQPLGNQHIPSRLVFGLHSCPNTILYYKLAFHSIPHHPPNVNISYTTLHVQLAKFLYLIWHNFSSN